MKLEVEFSQVEAEILKLEFSHNSEKLADKWNVNSFEEFVQLLTMHGLDHLKEIAG